MDSLWKGSARVVAASWLWEADPQRKGWRGLWNALPSIADRVPWVGIKDPSCSQALNLSHQHNCHAPPPGFPGISVDKESSYNARDPGSIPGWGRFPGEGNGYPLQYSCLGSPMERGAWWATLHEGLKESDTTEGLNHYDSLRCRGLLTGGSIQDPQPRAQRAQLAHSWNQRLLASQAHHETSTNRWDPPSAWTTKCNQSNCMGLPLAQLKYLDSHSKSVFQMQRLGVGQGVSAPGEAEGTWHVIESRATEGEAGQSHIPGMRM